MMFVLQLASSMAEVLVGGLSCSILSYQYSADSVCLAELQEVAEVVLAICRARLEPYHWPALAPASEQHIA